MIRFETWKSLLVAVVLVLAAAFAAPNVIPFPAPAGGEARGIGPLGLFGKAINLGLDLQGGSYLLLEVDLDAVIEERIENLADAIRTEMREARIGISGLAANGGDVSFSLRNAGDEAAVRDALGNITGDDIIITAEAGRFRLGYSETGRDDLASTTVAQAIEIIRTRIDETGTKEPVIQRQGQDRILIQLPGVDDPEAIKRLLGRTAKLGFQLVDTTRSAGEAQASGRIPPGSEILPAADDSGTLYLLKKRVLVSGDMLDDARSAFGQDNDPVVNFTLNATGGARFGRVTGENIGRPFAIVLDDKVISAPVIRAQIFSSGQISGDFTIAETEELALLLRAGALPAPLLVLEERSVGPGLGSDSIAAGKTAVIIGIIAVIAFMVASYGVYGIIATIALGFNFVMLIAALSVLQATLTLPGIAGIVLTMGMAVDANVLIFERIREELRRGRSVRDAVAGGFAGATRAIVDANLTTLVAVACLYLLGSGPIKGFSVTLGIGVVTSMFTAILATRMMITLWVNLRRPAILAM